LPSVIFHERKVGTATEPELWRKTMLSLSLGKGWNISLSMNAILRSLNDARGPAVLRTFYIRYIFYNAQGEKRLRLL